MRVFPQAARIRISGRAGAGAVRQRARFGTVRPRVRIPGPRPSFCIRFRPRRASRRPGIVQGGHRELTGRSRPVSSPDARTRGLANPVSVAILAQRGQLTERCLPAIHVAGGSLQTDPRRRRRKECSLRVPLAMAHSRPRRRACAALSEVVCQAGSGGLGDLRTTTTLSAMVHGGQPSLETSWTGPVYRLH